MSSLSPRPHREPLQSKHAVWIVDAALENFLEKIQDAETDLVRHENIRAVPLATKQGIKIGARTDKIQSIKDYLCQYYTIVAALAEVREVAVNATAAEFAKQFKTHFQ